MQPAAVLHDIRARHFGMHQPRSRSHPLHVARFDNAVVTEGILVLHRAFKQIRDRLESTVRVIGKADRLARLKVQRSEVIKQQERVDVFQPEVGNARRMVTPPPSVVRCAGAICCTVRYFVSVVVIFCPPGSWYLSIRYLDAKTIVKRFKH